MTLSRFSPAVAVVTVLFTLAACQQATPQAATAPPPEVGVLRVSVQPITLTTELPGRLSAFREAQVRARVAGILQKRVFSEGSEVKAGQTLFLIDAQPYQASLASAQATLTRAEAILTQAMAQAERFKPLVEANAISKQEYINAVAAAKSAEADVAAGKAAVQTARINLSYASVAAPISGRIGQAMVTEGALVGQGEATQLALIQQLDMLYLNFTQSSSQLLKFRKAFDEGKLKRAGAEAAEVTVLLDDGSAYALPGRLLFSDITVDPTTNQVTLRAQVPNPDRLLLPGMYVRVRLDVAQSDSGFLIPQQAVTRSAQGDTVLRVDDKGQVKTQAVELGPAQKGNWIVLGGLQPGELIVVDGVQKIRAGQTVKPVPWQPATATPIAAAQARASSATVAQTSRP